MSNQFADGFASAGPQSIVVRLGSKPTRFERRFFADLTLLCVLLKDRSRRRQGESVFFCRAMTNREPAQEENDSAADLQPQTSRLRSQDLLLAGRAGDRASPQRSIDPDALEALAIQLKALIRRVACPFAAIA